MIQRKPLTKKQQEAIRHAELGRCVALTEKQADCRNWAIDRYADRPYCGQHLNSIVLREDDLRRKLARKALLDAEIDRLLAWHAEHPSVHEPAPASC